MTDLEGAALPGCTVEISGPTLSGTRTTVSGSDGRFRFSSIPPGRYQVRAILSGFGIATATATVALDQSSEVVLRISAGPVPTPSPVRPTPPATPRPTATPSVLLPTPVLATPRPTATPEVITTSTTPEVLPTQPPGERPVTAIWNQWVTDLEDNRVKTLAPPQRGEQPSSNPLAHVYRFYVDLSAFDLSPVRAVASRSASDVLLAVVRDTRIKKVDLKVLPIVVGDGFESVEGQQGWQSVTVDVEALRNVKPELGRQIRAGISADEFLKLADRVSGLRREEKWVPITIDLKAVKPGCGAVALSIWDKNLDTPLDQLIWPVSVGDKPCAVNDRADRTLTSALLERFSLLPDPPSDAALHVFEIQRQGDRPSPVAVFARKGQATRVWKIGTPMTKVVTDAEPFVKQARSQKKSYDFKNVSKCFTKTLFASEEGKKAYAEIVKMAKEAGGRRLTISARIVDNSGMSLPLPLGLLDVENKDYPLGHYATLRASLRRERVLDAIPCVRNWTIVTNSSDTGEAPTVSTASGAMKFITEWEGASTHLTSGNACSKPPGAPEGLFLEAHHGDEKIAFDREFVPGSKYLTTDELSHCYPEGSVGFFFLCSFLNSATARVPLTFLEAFNSHGIDVAITSPFSVDAIFASHFRIALETVLAKVGKDGATVDEIFRLTVKELDKTDDHKEAVEAYEMTILGNLNLKVCGGGR